MARKGVLIMNNWFELLIDILTPVQAIELLKIIKATSDGVDYEISDEVLKTHWFHMKHTVESSIEMYDNLTNARREAGKLGGAPKGNSNASKNKQKQAKQPNQPMNKKKDKDIPYPSDKDQDMGDVSSSLGDDSTPPKFKTIDEAAAYYEQQ